ncbi:MAG: hypothetical protein ACKVZH_21360 [Blastocatellia bacterium]
MTSTSGIYPNIDLHPTQVFDISPNYLEAMDNARFVRTCGIAALVFSALTLGNFMAVNIAVSIGIGMFMMWHDHENYRRALGIVALIAASAFVPNLSPLIFSVAVFCRGREVLAALNEERKAQENWPLTFRRARIGTIASAAGLGVNSSMIVLSAAIFLLKLLQ